MKIPEDLAWEAHEQDSKLTRKYQTPDHMWSDWFCKGYYAAEVRHRNDKDLLDNYAAEARAVNVYLGKYTSNNEAYPYPRRITHQAECASILIEQLEQELQKMRDKAVEAFKLACYFYNYEQELCCGKYECDNRCCGNKKLFLKKLNEK